MQVKKACDARINKVQSTKVKNKKRIVFLTVFINKEAVTASGATTGSVEGGLFLPKSTKCGENNGFS